MANKRKFSVAEALQQIVADSDSDEDYFASDDSAGNSESESENDVNNVTVDGDIDDAPAVKLDEGEANAGEGRHNIASGICQFLVISLLLTVYKCIMSL